MNKAGTIFYAALLLIWLCQPVQALEPEKTEALVYKYYAFNGFDHKITYAPPKADTIFLLADTDNTFNPSYTLIYYWPLTREYFQSWERLDVPVGGKLEILQNGRVIQVIERKKTVLYYPHGPYGGGSVVLRGPRAVAKFEAYQDEFSAFKKASASFYRQMVVYQKKIRDTIRQRPPDADAPDPPAKPVEPSPPQFYVSEYRQEMVINLPPGRYTLRLRDDHNQLVEGSERKLNVFKSLGQFGVGYELIPEERWTKPLTVHDPRDGIYTRAGKSFYLVPYRTEAYDEDSYNRLLNPQNSGRRGVKKWIRREKLLSGQLVLMANGRTIQRLQRNKFYVEQTRGSELGYRIKQYAEAGEAQKHIEFEAIHLKFEDADQGNRYVIGLLNPSGAKISPESKREIRVVGKAPMAYIWSFAFIPCFVGLIILGWRRRKRVKHWEMN